MDMNADLTVRLREIGSRVDNSDISDPELELTALAAADEIERLRLALNPPHGKPEKLRIYVNRKLDKVWTPNKRAAHVAHAALEAFGVHPGVKIVVLDAGPTVIEQMRTHINDAGHTELEPGTLTAGTNWPEDSAP